MRAERLTPDQLEQIYVTGSARSSSCRCRRSRRLKTTTEPRDLKKFQQLNAVRIQGVIPPPVPLDQALAFLEDEARKILPQGFTIDYAGESRQLRTEGGRFLGTFLLSAVLIYLVLAAQFESFRDPFIILAGSVPLAVSGALLFSFLGFTTLNIYSQVGLITLVGLVSKNGILIVQFANHLRETGADKLEAVIEAAGDAAAADSDDDGGDRRRSLPAGARDRPRRRRAQQHRHHARERHDHRHGLHAVRRAVDLHARRAQSRASRSRQPGAARARRRLAGTGGGSYESRWFTSRRRSPRIGAHARSTTGGGAGRREPRPFRSRSPTPCSARSSTIPDLAIVRLDTEVEAARVGESRGAFAPVFSTTLGRSRNVTPPTNSLLGDRGVDVEGLVLVDRRAAAPALGRRHMERLVGHGADDDEQPDQQLRSEPAVGHPARVLAAAAAGSHDRRGAAAVHRREAQSATAPSCAFASRSCRRSRRSSRRTGR